MTGNKYETCPHSNKKLLFRQVNGTKTMDSFWLVVSGHGWQSKPFETLAQAKEWASFRGGRQTYTAPKVEVAADENDKVIDSVLPGSDNPAEDIAVD